jgi:hypothetical protein
MRDEGVSSSFSLSIIARKDLVGELSCPFDNAPWQVPQADNARTHGPTGLVLEVARSGLNAGVVAAIFPAHFEQMYTNSPAAFLQVNIHCIAGVVGARHCGQRSGMPDVGSKMGGVRRGSASWMIKFGSFSLGPPILCPKGTKIPRASFRPPTAPTSRRRSRQVGKPTRRFRVFQCRHPQAAA